MSSTSISPWTKAARGEALGPQLPLHQRTPTGILGVQEEDTSPHICKTNFDPGLCCKVARVCGKLLLEEIGGDNCSSVFDATMEHAARLYDVVCLPDVDDVTPSYRRSDVEAADRESAFMFARDAELPESPGAQMSVAPSSPTRRPRLHSGSNTDSSMKSDGTAALMTRSSLIRALEHEGFIGMEDEPAFKSLWEVAGQDALNLRSFHTLLRLLKLHLLCAGLSRRPMLLPHPALEPETGFIGFVDWGPRNYMDAYFNRPSELTEFFLSHRSPGMRMRWVHCEAVSRTTLLRLAVKYQLHPLPVDDTIRLEQQSLPLVRKYGGNFFVVLPLLRLTEESKRMLYKHRQARQTCVGGVANWPQAKAKRAESHWHVASPSDHVHAGDDDLPCMPQVEQCRLALFVSGPPMFDTVISVRTPWKVSWLQPDYDRDDGPEQPGGLCGRRASKGQPPPTSQPAESVGVGEVREVGPESDTQVSKGPDAFDAVVTEIQADFSMVRAGNASWLLWRLLDVSIDELQPVLAAYRAQLRWFSTHVVQEDANVSESVEKRLLRSKAELDWLIRKVRPGVRVLKHLIHDKAIDPDVTRYLEDVEDHMSRFLEEVGSMIAVFASLRDEVLARRDRSEQKVLYVLTLVTIMVMPAHLLTGLYGMNFQDAMGKPVVPGLGQLQESRGYVLFWGLSIVMTTSIYLIFSNVLGWI